MANRPQHPSGRPIRSSRIVGKPIWRIPDRGPVTPGLQKENQQTQAIGFLASLCRDDEQDE